MRILGVNERSNPTIKRLLQSEVSIVKPGFCRLSLTFFMSDAEASCDVAVENH